MKKNKEKITGVNKVPAILTSVIYLLICAGLIIVTYFLPKGCSVNGFDLRITTDNKSDYLALLGIHYTVVFLTTSLMSTLGERENVVYYENLVRRTLIKPVGRTFKDLSVYAFLTLFTASIAFLLRSVLCVMVSFVVGTIVIIYLFLKMIKIYYGKEKIKREIFNEMTKGKANYNENLQKLYGIILSNIEENDTDKVVENIAFVIELMLYYRESKNNRYAAAKSIYDTALELIQAKAPFDQVSFLFDLLDYFDAANNDEAVKYVFDNKLLPVFRDLPQDSLSRNELELAKTLYKSSVVERMFDNESKAILEAIEKVDVAQWNEESTEMEEFEDSAGGGHLGQEEITYKCECDKRITLAKNIGEKVVAFVLGQTFPKRTILDDSDPFVPVRYFSPMIRKCVKLDERLVKERGYKLYTRLPYTEPSNYPGARSYYYIPSFGGDRLFVEHLPHLLYQYGGEDYFTYLKEFFVSHKAYYYDDYGFSEKPYYIDANFESNNTIMVGFLKSCLEVYMLHELFKEETEAKLQQIAGWIGDYITTISQAIVASLKLKKIPPDMSITAESFVEDTFNKIAIKLLPYFKNGTEWGLYKENTKTCIQEATNVAVKFLGLLKENCKEAVGFDLEKISKDFLKDMKEMLPYESYTEDEYKKIEEACKQ